MYEVKVPHVVCPKCRATIFAELTVIDFTTLKTAYTIPRQCPRCHEDPSRFGVQEKKEEKKRDEKGLPFWAEFLIISVFGLVMCQLSEISPFFAWLNVILTVVIIGAMLSIF